MSSPGTTPAASVKQRQYVLLAGIAAIIIGAALLGVAVTTSRQVSTPLTKPKTTSIVAPGGDNSPGIPINDNEQLTGAWAIKAPLPFASRGPFAVSDGTVVYIGGGYDGTTVHADLLRYDPVANAYTPLAPSTAEFYRHHG